MPIGGPGADLTVGFHFLTFFRPFFLVDFIPIEKKKDGIENHEYLCESMICKSVFCWNLSAKSHINFHFFLESREILRWSLLIILASFFVHVIPIEKKIISFRKSSIIEVISWPGWFIKSNLFISKIYGNIYVHI